MSTITLLLALTASAAQIDIDTASPYQTLNPIYRDFAQGGESCDYGYYSTIVEPIRKLNPRIIRFDHVLNCFTDVKLDKGNMATDFANLHRMVDIIEETGAEPLFCLSFTPIVLSPKGRNIDPPTDLALWREVIVRAVQSMKQRPKRVRYWEVWNEPNLEQFWTGTMDQYLDLYAVTARAVKEADPEARVGGGGFAGFPQEWVDGLLDRVVRDKLPFDFLSWHDYRSRAEDLRDQIVKARRMCDDRGLTKAELILDEWNFDAGMPPENDDHRGAAYVADHLRHMMDTPITYAPFFELKDGLKEGERYYGRWGLLTSDEKTKASYYCFLAHQELGPQRLRLNTSNPDVDGIATLKDGRVVFTLYNRSGEVRDVSLTLRNLPATGGNMSWKRRLIDAGHSNPARGSLQQLQAVEEEYPAANPKDGRYARSLSLPPWSVSLCEYAAGAGPAPKIECRLAPAPDTGFRDNRKWFGLSVHNPSGEAVSIISIRALTDADQPLELRGVEATSGAAPVFPMLLGPNGTARFLASVPIPLTASPYDVYVRAEITAEGSAAAGCGASFRVEPSLDIALSPAKIDWPQGVEPIAFSLALLNRSAVAASGPLNWAFSRILDVTPALPESYNLAPAHSSALTFNARPFQADIMSPSVVTAAVCAAVPGAPSGNDTIESSIRLIPSFTIPPHMRTKGAGPDLVGFAGHPATGQIMFGATEEEWSAFWLAWHKDYLNFRMEIRDASHVQNQSGAGIWNGDSVQLAFDMDWDALAGQHGYDDDDVEIGFALGPNGPEAYSWKAAGHGLPGRIDLPLTIIRNEGSTDYEARISWTLLGRNSINAGDGFGFALVWNDNDGTARRNASWASGVALSKEPWRFFHIVTVERE